MGRNFLNKEWFDKFDTILDDSNKNLEELSKQIHLDYENYGMELLKSGMSIDGYTAEEIIKEPRANGGDREPYSGENPCFFRKR